MRRFRSACLALVSAAALGTVASAARPHYGGTLRVEAAGVVRSLDPAVPAADEAEAWIKTRIAPLVFETLTTVDGDAGVQPLLAASWESSGSRWRLRIRRNVVMHDESTLQAWQVSAVLRAANPAWTVDADGDVVTVDHGPPDLLWQLAQPREGIAVRGSSGDLAGSGPFKLDRLADRRLMLHAHDRYWGSRPFLDAVQVEMGRSAADQLSSLERGGADVVSVRPTDARRLSQRGLRMAASRPMETIALVFEAHRATGDYAVMRAALAAAIDRRALCDVLLQQRASPAAALLPPWISGYAPLDAQVPSNIRATVAGLPPAARAVTVRVDPGDAVEQAIADRIVVDAHEAGLTISVQAPSGLAPRPDVRIVRLPLEASSPDRVLAGVMAGLGARVTALASADAQVPAAGAPIEVVYSTERALLEHQIIVPLVHMPDLYGLGDRVRSWNGPVLLAAGALNLANIWIE